MRLDDIWLTPLHIISACGQFDLDPCGCKLHPTARIIWEGDEGLFKPYFGNVWMNPPYSNPYPLLRRLADHGHGVALVFSKTDTAWFQEIYNTADEILFLKGRLKFLKPHTKTYYSAMKPSCLFAWNNKLNKLPGIRIIRNA